MKAVLGKITGDVSHVVAQVHPPISGSMVVLADSGDIADGQIVAKDEDGKTIAHKKTTGVAMTGTVDGANKAFTATLSPAPVLPGSVKIDNNNVAAQSLVDDGHGRLEGDGEGTVNYETGEVSATFTTAPAAGKTVLIAHKTRPVGVNVGACDTEEDDSASVLVHGTVNRSLVLTGSSAADAEDIAALKAIGIFAI
ncbi:MAG TPA: hypothetical protein PLB91_01190 [Spirochaetales bacterium]|nr:hypothetical protein [Spirochaetales bacterium]